MSKITDQRRQDILNAAAEEFYIRGVNAASIASIAARAGIGKSTVYEYFSSKAELFLSVCENKIQQVQDRIQTIFTQNTTFHQKLLDYANTMDFDLSPMEVFRILQALTRNSTACELAERIQILQRTITTHVRDAILLAQERGELSPALNPDFTARYLILIPTPYMLHNLQEFDSNQTAQRLVNLVMHGLH